jgi:uncharacterized protein (DUF927 family)
VSDSSGQRARRRLPTADRIKAAIRPADFYADALPDAPALKARRDGWSQNIKCCFHDEENGSFGVNLDTGAFRCFGCGANGGSVIDFTMLRDGLDFDGARAELADRYQIEPGPAPTRPPAKAKTRKRKAAPKPPAPIPPDALKSRPTAHPSRGRPSATYEYRDPAGRTIVFVLRFDPPKGRKVFTPLRWTEGAGWQWKTLEEPRPLYGLDAIAARPAAPVVLCEGEKAADAAGELMPEAVATTTMHGARAADTSDFSPLRGRRLLIWPDNDQPGAEYAETAAKLAREAGAESVAILDLASLAADGDLPIEFDAADALADGWDAGRFAAAARWKPAAQAEPAKTADDDADGPPFPFELRDAGIYYRKPEKAKGGGDAPPLWICSALRVAGTTRDDSGNDFGRLIEFRDPDGIERQAVIEAGEWQGSGEALRARLARMGLEISTHTESRRLFLELLQRWRPAARARSTPRTGWTPDGTAFVTPARVIGEAAEPVILAADTAEPAAFATRGTLEDWRRNVAALCVGNSRLLFSVSVAFAAPLLKIAGAESGGFHLRGRSTDASSSGKTTAQRVAASVCGPPDSYLRSWRTTDNALESVAECHTDSLLILDELGQIDPKAAGESAYMLANGRGKGRAGRDGGGRQAKTWRLLYLSSGELGLAELLAGAGRSRKGGQEVRLLEIPADAGAGLGVFENLHGDPDSGAFALRLADAAAANFGAAFPAYIEALLKHRVELPGLIGRMRRDFLTDALGRRKVAGIVDRAAKRFALVGIAGELATEAAVTGWPTGAARDAALRCFVDWLDARGGVVPAEERDLLAQVRLWFEKHSNRLRWVSRALDDHSPEVPQQAGFKDAPDGEGGGLVFYVFPETFAKEICAGHDAPDAARLLVARGLLRPGGDGRPTQKERLPGFRNPKRVYVFGADMGGGSDGP